MKNKKESPIHLLYCIGDFFLFPLSILLLLALFMNNQPDSKKTNQDECSTNHCEINFLCSHNYFPFFLLLFLSSGLLRCTNQSPKPNITIIINIAIATIPGVFMSPKKLASKSAVNIYLATSINHFPNSSPISISFLLCKDTTFYQTMQENGDKKNLKIFYMVTISYFFARFKQIIINLFGLYCKNLYLCTRKMKVRHDK